ncbi:hydroxyacylglutathione hydrolase-like protein isoform X1 [Tachysurus ichikawai]
MRVKIISILEDNYMYLVIDEQSKEAIAVDPAVPHRLLERIKREGVRLICSSVHLYSICTNYSPSLGPCTGQ